MECYILQGRELVPVDWMTWAQWLEKTDERVIGGRLVPVSFISIPVLKARVSTVFLGLDHSFSDIGPPMLFETMVFGGPLDQQGWRCSTYDEAEKMHQEVCERVKATPITAKWIFEAGKDAMDRNIQAFIDWFGDSMKLFKKAVAWPVAWGCHWIGHACYLIYMTDPIENHAPLWLYDIFWHTQQKCLAWSFNAQNWADLSGPWGKADDDIF